MSTHVPSLNSDSVRGWSDFLGILRYRVSFTSHPHVHFLTFWLKMWPSAWSEKFNLEVHSCVVDVSFYYSILDFYNSILDFYNLILDFYYSILDFYYSILDFYNSMLDFFNSILNFYYSMLDFLYSILAFYYSILNTVRKEILPVASPLRIG